MSWREAAWIFAGIVAVIAALTVTYVVAFRGISLL